MKRIFLLAGLLAFGTAQAQEERNFYVGANYVDLDIASFEDVRNPAFNEPDPKRTDFNPKMLRISAGMLLNEDFALEIQYGTDGGDDAGVEVDEFIGGYLSSRTQLTTNLHGSFLLGYGQVSLMNAGTDTSEDGISYGLNTAYPFNTLLGKVPVFGDLLANLPDVILNVGYMVYQQNDDSTTDGVNIGLQYDFTR